MLKWIWSFRSRGDEKERSVGIRKKGARKVDPKKVDPQKVGDRQEDLSEGVSLERGSRGSG
jgi:hypothetical protein